MTISLKKIKNACAIAAFFCMAICTPTQGMTAAVSAITPIITDFALELWPKITDKVRTLATREGQCALCSKTGGLSCNADLMKETCKARCQERVEMGSGYILKIRYAGKWNMRTCMEAQQKTCLKAVAKSKGKGKKTEADCRKESSAPREVAVYNERDLKLAKELITTIVASEEIIAKGGKLKPKTTKEDAEKGRDQALKDLVDKYGEESDKGLGHLESAKDLIRKIVNNEMILTSYGEKPEAEKTPAENVKEAKKERIRATNELKKLIPTFGPQ